MIERGDWQVSEVARNAFDLEGKVIGTIGAGRIGYRVLQRLVPFNPKELLYFDYAPLPEGMHPSTSYVSFNSNPLPEQMLQRPSTRAVSRT